MPTAAQIKVAAASKLSLRSKLTTGEGQLPSSAPVPSKLVMWRTDATPSNSKYAIESTAGTWLGGGWRRSANPREHTRGPPGFLLCRDGRVHTPGPGSYCTDVPSSNAGFSMGLTPLYRHLFAVRQNCRNRNLFVCLVSDVC
jgi:hypothetical protein